MAEGMDEQGVTAEQLDEYAAAYYLKVDASPDLFIEERLQQHVIKLIADRLSQDDNVLEMGFGTGVVAPALVERGFKIEVLEGSPALCARAREVLPGIPVHESLFEDFRADRIYDVVLCLFTLEHVDDPATVVRTAARWLKPDGLLIASVPNAGSVHREVAVLMGIQASAADLSERDVLVGHQRVFSRPELEEAVKSAHLEVDFVWGSFLKVVPNSLMLQWAPELIDALCIVSERLPPDACANIVVGARLPASLAHD